MIIVLIIIMIIIIIITRKSKDCDSSIIFTKKRTTNIPTLNFNHHNHRIHQNAITIDKYLYIWRYYDILCLPTFSDVDFRKFHISKSKRNP